jgi:hypothetical protein
LGQTFPKVHENPNFELINNGDGKKVIKVTKLSFDELLAKMSHKTSSNLVSLLTFIISVWNKLRVVSFQKN